MAKHAIKASGLRFQDGRHFHVRGLFGHGTLSHKAEKPWAWGTWHGSGHTTCCEWCSRRPCPEDRPDPWSPRASTAPPFGVRSSLRAGALGVRPPPTKTAPLYHISIFPEPCLRFHLSKASLAKNEVWSSPLWTAGKPSQLPDGPFLQPCSQHRNTRGSSEHRPCHSKGEH